ncbi:hypothetical protein CP97_07080 [Aurantiacibacter atlanticus]|uniref:Uncharacterized protein n=1 Tax=Aurantiacibacter atlanticus TaxID=1648404 RepID=A0A0H4VBN9_9SPHN|nr:hypothetical protein CP97_07080 [Aurantiacibacter atlanticus]
MMIEKLKEGSLESDFSRELVGIIFSSAHSFEFTPLAAKGSDCAKSC